MTYQIKIPSWIKLTFIPIFIIFLNLFQLSQAQEYPIRPITIVVPFPAGTAVDNAIRPLTNELQKILGQPIIVDNRPGAQGVIGSLFVAKSKSDGYTLLAGSSTTLAANVGLFKNLPFNPLKDFQPISGLGYTSMLFAVRSDSPIKDIKGLISQYKNANTPIAAGYGSSSGRVALAILSKSSNVAFTTVPYKGTPQVINDLISGILPFAAFDVGSAVPHIKPGGKLTALAITGTGRSVSAPELPTLSEMYPGTGLITWLAIVGPAGMEISIVNKLQNAITLALTKQEIKQNYAALSIEVEPLAADDLSKRMQKDQAIWLELIRTIGIEPE